MQMEVRRRSTDCQRRENQGITKASRNIDRDIRSHCSIIKSEMQISKKGFLDIGLETEGQKTGDAPHLHIEIDTRSRASPPLLKVVVSGVALVEDYVN